MLADAHISSLGSLLYDNNDLNQVWKTKGYQIKIFEKKSQYVFMNLKPLSQDIDIQLNA